MTAVVQDARPPTALLRVLNPIMRTILRSPASRAMSSLALLRFEGRRTHRPITVTVGYHAANGDHIVFTPASWRASFAGGHNATVRHRGRRQPVVGTLDTDPSSVAEALTLVIGAGTSPRAIGLRVPKGHTITAADVAALDRAMITFRTAAD
jgi:hypothetical protein